MAYHRQHSSYGQKASYLIGTTCQILRPSNFVRLGTQLLVVGSSAAAATEILKIQDRLLSARFVPEAIPYQKHVLDRIAIVWASRCTDEWKFLRALCRSELFSAGAIGSQATLREKKVAEMIKVLGTSEGKVVSIGDTVFVTVFNTLSNLIFSKDLIRLDDKGVANGLKGLVRRLMELGATPNMADFYPIFASLDPQGIKRKALKSVKDMFAIWEIHIKERRKSHTHDAAKNDFLDVFLANGFDDEQINWLALELLTAGTDTTTTTTEWAMAELLKNEVAMKKVCEEINREINRNPLKESHLSQLPYLTACVKETLRLHPPAPLLVPHRAMESCEVLNYTIPKDCQVMVNIWAIGRDPSAWDDPLLFKPERFLGSNLDFKGQDYRFLPFGSGRRMCPGLPMATRLIPLLLATMLYYFDWSLPSGQDPAELDMNESFGITLQKEKPLRLVPKQKLKFED